MRLVITNLIFLAATILPTMSVAAQYTVPSTGSHVGINLAPGTYQISAVSGGWNAWGGVVDLPDAGWLCDVTVVVNGINVSGVGSGAIYTATPEEAIAACSTNSFEVCPLDTIFLASFDPFPDDNIGDTTVDVSQISSEVPAWCPDPVIEIASYPLTSSFSDELGGPDLVPNGGTLQDNGYVFGPGQGLSLTNVLNPTNYSIEMLFRVDSTTGLGVTAKLIDFANLTSDVGWYTGDAPETGDNAKMGFFTFNPPGFHLGPDPVFEDNVFAHMVVTRNGVTGEVNGYVNGVEQLSFIDSFNEAVFAELGAVANFFLDDGTGFEESGGFVDFINIYDAPLSASAVAELISDTDGDGEPDFWDNCHTVPNFDQSDSDSDGIGDLCEIGEILGFSDGGTPIIGDALTCQGCIADGWLLAAGSIALNAGEDGPGDNAVIYDSNGRGFHFLTWDGYATADTRFLGNYVEAHVMALRFKARHTGSGDSLTLRAFAFRYDDGREDGVLSNTSAIIANTDTTWQTYTISLLPSDLETIVFGGGVPRTANEILAAVIQVGLRHDPTFSGPTSPAWTDTAVYFDDIQLVLDSDDDGIEDGIDNCPTVWNEDQEDINDDGFGDACVSPDVVIPPGTEIGDNPMIGSGTTIGNRTSIGDNADLGDDVIIAKDLEIGDDVTVGDNSEIAKDCVIGDGVTIGANVFIGKGCVIGNGVTIGDGSTINKDSTIGNNAVLGTNVTMGKNATVTADAVVPNGTNIPNGGTFP
jgi:acetyltransferase-like isoleucine patch superfamily enzyme